MRSIAAATLVLVAPIAFALDPTAPVVRIDRSTGAIIERRGSIPQRWISERGETVNYHRAPSSWHLADGWRQASIITVTNSIQEPIPSNIVAVAAAYYGTMEELFGSGAATNEALGEAAVAIDLSLRSDVSADVGLRLKTWYEILNAWWGRGEVWSFPWGAESWIREEVSEEWSVTPSP